MGVALLAWPPRGLWGCPLSADPQGSLTADVDRRDGVLGIVHGDTGAREGCFACLQAHQLRVTTGPLLATPSCTTPGTEGLRNSSCLWDVSVPHLVCQVS